jgi:hypothetical protein
MTRLTRIVLVTSALVLPLGGCASIGDALDPSDWFSGDFFNTKKKLPGDRKAVFPEGVPGVAQGIPQELVKGNQPPPQESGFASTDTQSVGSTSQQKQKTAAKPEEYQPAPREKAKPKPKPKPATAERQPPAQERPPASTTTRRAPEPQQQQQQAGGSGAQWPDPPPPQRGGSQAGGVQWPDPPPLR